MIEPQSHIRADRPDPDAAGGAAAKRPPMPITARAILLGTFCVAVMTGIVPYTSFVSRIWSPGDGALLSGPVQALLLLLLLNVVLKRAWPAVALTRGELLAAYGVQIIVLATVSGMTANAVAIVGYPIHLASPENGWPDALLPYIPDWYRLPENVAHWLWRGLPADQGVPWSAWIRPMLASSTCYVAVMTALFCLGNLLRRDWIERQRLAFPVADIPLALTGQEERPTLGSGMFRSPIFWLGFFPPALVTFVNWLHLFYPNGPHIQLGAEPGRWFKGMGLPWSVLGDMQYTFQWVGVSIAALIPGDVSLSLWLFHVLYRVYILVWASFGITSTGTDSFGEINRDTLDPHALAGLAEAGGFIALGALTLYQSRKALKAAWLGLRGSRLVDDAAGPHGAMAGRWAALGLMLSTLFLMWWTVRSGMSWWFAVVLLGLFYTYCVCTSRLVAAAGVMWPHSQNTILDVLSRTLGPVTIGRRSLIAATYVDSIFLLGMYETTPTMAHMMNSFKVLYSGRVSGRRYTWAVAIGVVIMLAVAIPVMLWVTYHVGAGKMNNWSLNAFPRRTFAALDARLLSMQPPSFTSWLWMLGGAGIMFGLVHMHTHYLWWPVSPIGFIVASSEMTNRHIWHNYFIGWLISVLIRRFGGLHLYAKLRPAFLGMIIGQIVAWFVLYVGGRLIGLPPPPPSL